MWQQLIQNVWFTLGLAIAAGILGEIFFRWFYRWFGRITESTTTHLDDLLMARMRYPVQVAIWLGAVLIFLHLEPQFSTSRIRQIIDVIEAALVIYIVVETFDTLLIDYVMVERKKIDVPHLLRDLGRVIVFSVLGMALLRNVFNTDLTAFIATSTVVTVVLGLALQNTLGNLFAGIALHLERPFKIGDWLLYRNIEGRVVRLGWRSTVLQNLDGDWVTIPNNTIAVAEVINFYAPSKLHARKLRFVVRHTTAPRDVEAALTRAAENVPRVLKDQPYKIWLVEYSPVAITYVVKFWIEDFAFHDDIESELMKQIWYAFEEMGIELPLAGAILLSNPADEMTGRQ